MVFRKEGDFKGVATDRLRFIESYGHGICNLPPPWCFCILLASKVLGENLILYKIIL